MKPLYNYIHYKLIPELLDFHLNQLKKIVQRCELRIIKRVICFKYLRCIHSSIKHSLFNFFRENLRVKRIKFRKFSECFFSRNLISFKESIVITIQCVSSDTKDLLKFCGSQSLLIKDFYSPTSSGFTCWSAAIELEQISNLFIYITVIYFHVF